jgi:RND family efflux transporter MFP subunit
MFFLRFVSMAAVVNALVGGRSTAAPPVSVDTEPATVEASKRVAIYARLGGFVREIRVDLGDRVEKGQVLVELLIPDLEAELKEKTVQVEQAKAELEHAKLALIAVEAELRGPVAKPTDLTALKARVEVAKATVNVARTHCEVVKAQALRTQILLGYGVLRAPFAGVISEKNVEAGALVLPATNPVAKPLFVVDSTNPIRVTVEVPELYAARVGRNTKAIVELDGLPRQKFQGQVTRISGVISPAHRTMLTQIDLLNPSGKLLPGMCGHVSLILDELPSFDRVPTSKALISPSE